MRQRNDNAHAVHVSAWPTDEDPDRLPFDVQIGEEKNFPTLLPGFTSLEPAPTDEPAAEDDPAAEDAPVKPKTRGKTAAADADGGEPR